VDVRRVEAESEATLGGRLSSAPYQYTLTDSNPQELNDWTPQILDSPRTLPGLTDVTSDQQKRRAQGLADHGP
jgi:HAE1 family hydrophobic/amphiphilic exporter-1